MDQRLRTAERAARAAGALLRDMLGTHIHVRSKDVRSNLVTEADTRSEALIRTMIAEDFPDDSVLGEEGGASGGSGTGRWIVDPLDGTTNFAHGYRCFCVSIAYEKDGALLAGAVYDPMADEMYKAERGAGASCDDKVLAVSPHADLRDGLLVTGFPPLRDVGGIPNLEMMANFMRRAQAVRRDGSAALDLCYVAAGRFEGFWEAGLHAWDVAAGALIVAEAGGRVTDYSGKPLRVDCGEMLASNGLVHDAMLEVLRAGP
ncbi:MAG TPA: inositol monophosphatase family protein [Candidatus Eremiobacteraceae bacterium]